MKQELLFIHVFSNRFVQVVFFFALSGSKKIFKKAEKILIILGLPFGHPNQKEMLISAKGLLYPDK